jgi:CheY-like chemotaxis protein
VCEVLNDTLKLFTPIASAKGLYLNSNISGGHFNIYSDREMLTKIFNNLVNNAIKYTQTGHVSIEFSITKNGDGKYVIVDVRDTGIGIPEEYHEIIFEPFRQVSEGYTRRFEGTGLGLSITSKLVHLLGGTISLKSNTGKGSVFTVKLPFIEADEIRGQNNFIPAISLSDFTLPKDYSILIVEDDLSNAHLISAYLKPYCLVEHVINGESAINHCKSRIYDAILMDINLKGMNGIECFNEIRGLNDHYAGIPVLAVTALAMAGDRERLLSLGFTGYLSKPFERVHLLSLLANVIKVTRT